MLDKDGNYSVTAHARSLTYLQLLDVLSKTPTSALGSPLHAALVAEREQRDGVNRGAPEDRRVLSVTYRAGRNGKPRTAGVSADPSMSHDVIARIIAIYYHGDVKVAYGITIDSIAIS